MSKAMELADACDKQALAWRESSDAYKERKETAAELRRLDAENAQLRAELEAIYSAEPVAWRSKTGHGTYFREAITDDLKNIVFGGNRMWSPLIPLPERKS